MSGRVEEKMSERVEDSGKRIAVIPAAGMATRLRPLTEHTPKCLLEVGGKALLGRAVEALMQNGIDEAVIVTGYLAPMIESYMAENYPAMKVHFVHNERYASTNNIYSLYLSAPYAAGRDILLLDSDILFDPEIISRLLACPDSEALALERHPLGAEEIKVTIDEKGMVRDINKEVDPAVAIGESTGLEKMGAEYTRELFNVLDTMIKEEGLDNVFYEKAFERLIARDMSLRPVDITGLTAMELDTVEDFDKARTSTNL